MAGFITFCVKLTMYRQDGLRVEASMLVTNYGRSIHVYVCYENGT